MKFELTTYTTQPKAPSKEIVEAVTALRDATDAHVANGGTDKEYPALRLVLDIKDEAKDLRAFRQAAKDLGKTVRMRTRDDSALTEVGRKENGKAIYQGEVIVTVSLADKYADGRGRPKSDAKSESKNSK